MYLDFDFMLFYGQTWQLIDFTSAEGVFVQWPKQGWRVRLQHLKATALDLPHHGWKNAVEAVESNRTRFATPRLESAVGAVKSNRTRPATPRLKSVVEAAESNHMVAWDCAIDSISVKRCCCLRIFQPLCNRICFQPYQPHFNQAWKCLTHWQECSTKGTHMMSHSWHAQSHKIYVIKRKASARNQNIWCVSHVSTAW